MYDICVCLLNIKYIVPFIIYNYTKAFIQLSYSTYQITKSCFGKRQYLFNHPLLKIHYYVTYFW